MDNRTKEQFDVISLDSVVEPVTITILIALLVIGRFFNLAGLDMIVYYSTILIGFFYTIFWYHLFVKYH